MQTETDPSIPFVRRMTDRFGAERSFAIAFVVVVAAQALILAVYGTKQWFFFDEWRLVVERTTAPRDGLLDVLRIAMQPDGEHVIAVPLLLFMGLTISFGINSYVWFVIANIVLRTATLIVAERLMRKLGAGPAARLTSLTLLAFFGAGYESLFGQSLIFAAFTLVFSLLALLLVSGDDEPSMRTLVLAGISLTIAVFSSSYAFPAILAVAIVAVAARRRWTTGVVAAIPLGAFVLSRLFVSGSYANQQPVQFSKLGLYVGYLRHGLQTLGEGITGLTGSGLLAYAALAAAALVLAVRRGRSTVVYVSAILLAVVAFYGQASLSRSIFGAEQAGASRYTFFAGALLLTALTAAWGNRKVTRAEAIALAALGFMSATSNIVMLMDGQQSYSDGMAVSRDRLEVGFALADDGFVGFQPDPDWAPDLFGDRMAPVAAWGGSQGVSDDGRACVSAALDAVLPAIGDLALPSEQRIPAIVVLVNERYAAAGPERLTADVLVSWGASGATGSKVLDQFTAEFVQIEPFVSSDVVVDTSICG